MVMGTCRPSHKMSMGLRPTARRHPYKTSPVGEKMKVLSFGAPSYPASAHTTIVVSSCFAHALYPARHRLHGATLWCTSTWPLLIAIGKIVSSKQTAAPGFLLTKSLNFSVALTLLSLLIVASEIVNDMP